MGYREQLERKIENKRRERHSLEQQINAADAYIAAMEDALRLLPREPKNAAVVEPVSNSVVVSPIPSPVTLRSGSDVAAARDAILSVGNPLHIAHILEFMEKENTKANRVSLTGTLSAYVRDKRVFVRTSPNTFGLIELGHQEKEGGNDE